MIMVDASRSPLKLIFDNDMLGKRPTLHRLRFFLIFLFVPLIVPTNATETLPEATAFQRSALHAGPGHTYFPSDVLNPGIPVEIIERNRVGNWVRVQRLTEDGEVAQDGWLMLGFLNVPESFALSEIPVNDNLPDADLDNVDSRSMRELYSEPLVPEISDAMVDVYELGTELSRQPDVVTKVGDSLSIDSYLEAMGEAERELGPYDYLAPTVDYYGDSTVGGSAAARMGLSSLVLFDSFWADEELCEPNETPLECEYRIKNPSVSFILFGPNDVLSMTDEQYAENIQRAVEDTLAAGIIPVLSTFSYHPDNENWWQSVEFNLRLTEIAAEYEVPIINLWAASRPLPDYGLGRDLIHMKQSGFSYLKFDTGHEAFYGTSLRNLLTVRTLHEIRLKLELGE